MDQRFSKSLRQAAELLKAGDAKKARSILVEILRQDSNVEHAWYMLSFAVPIQERQIYALQQTLRINPNNEKAKARLENLSGGSSSPLERDSQKKPIGDPPPEPQRIPFSSIEVSERDLLSQRLFGSGSDSEDLSPGTGDKEFAAPLPGSGPIKPEARKAAKAAESKGPRKRFLRRMLSRRNLVLLVLTAVIGGGAVIVFPEQFGLPSASVTITEEATETPGEEFTATPEATETATSTPTPTPTPTIPASTFTPRPTLTPVTIQATPTFSNRPTPIIIPTVDLDIDDPDADVQIEMAQIKAAITEIRGLDDIAGDRAFLVPDTKILNELQSYSRSPGYRVLISNMDLVYRLLGLVDPNNTLNGYPQNMWVEPDGGLYVPDNSGLLISGYSFGAREKYLYVQGIGQDLVNDLFDINSLGIYPLCEREAQTCDAIRALVKGDATLQASQWLSLVATTQEQYVQDKPNYFILPVTYPPLFLEPDLAFPYVSGESFVKALYDSGGWDAVNNAYLNLPETTEQILHPEKYLSEEGPIPVEHPPLWDILDEKWRQLFNESLGEWKLFLLLAYGADFSAVIDESVAERAVSGWGGDQIQIYYNDFQGDFALAAHWVWDSSTDASQFTATFGDYLEARNSAWSPLAYRDAECWERWGEVSCFYSSGLDVYWFIAPDVQTISAMFSLYELSEPTTTE